MNHNPTVLEISSEALKHNFNYFKSKIPKNTMALAVVKASGYGSDSIGVAKLLEESGVDYFAVAYADEGIALRNAGIKTPILVLHPQFQNLGILAEYNLEPNLYSKKVLVEFLKISKELELDQYPVHLKFNTGLNRLGFKKEDLEELFILLGAQSSIRIKTLFSHLVASEDLTLKRFTLSQIEKFSSIADHFERMWNYRPLLHMTNTSGVLNFPEAHFDMIRVGLGLYGFANDQEHTSKLKNVLALKSVISQIHTVGKGENVGYNMGFQASQDSRTATIPIGHADGIFRSLGQGKIDVRIRNRKAAVIGNICMDMIMVDVTDVECEEGDEVILFDRQVDILKMADRANTISYEILTALGPRIKRVLV